MYNKKKERSESERKGSEDKWTDEVDGDKYKCRKMAEMRKCSLSSNRMS